MFFVFRSVFALYGRPAMIFVAYASPIPGRVISCSFVAELMSRVVVAALAAVVLLAGVVLVVCVFVVPVVLLPVVRLVDVPCQAFTLTAESRKTAANHGPTNRMTVLLMMRLPGRRIRGAL